MPETHPIEDTLRAAVQHVAYGRAGVVDRIRVARAVRRDAAVRDLLQEHRRIAHAVRGLSYPPAPPAISRRAWGQIQREDPALGRGQAPRLLSAGAAVLALCLALLLGYRALGPTPDSEPVYTQAEIEEAQQQIEAALAHVRRGVAKAGRVVHQDVLAPNLSRPLRDGGAILHNLFGKETSS